MKKQIHLFIVVLLSFVPSMLLAESSAWGSDGIHSEQTTQTSTYFNRHLEVKITNNSELLLEVPANKPHLDWKHKSLGILQELHDDLIELKPNENASGTFLLIDRPQGYSNTATGAAYPDGEHMHLGADHYPEGEVVYLVNDPSVTDALTFAIDWQHNYDNMNCLEDVRFEASGIPSDYLDDLKAKKYLLDNNGKVRRSTSSKISYSCELIFGAPLLDDTIEISLTNATSSVVRHVAFDMPESHLLEPNPLVDVSQGETLSLTATSYTQSSPASSGEVTYNIFGGPDLTIAWDHYEQTTLCDASFDSSGHDYSILWSTGQYSCDFTLVANGININVVNETEPADRFNAGYAINGSDGENWNVSPDGSEFTGIPNGDVTQLAADVDETATFGALYTSQDGGSGEAYFTINDTSTSSDAKVSLDWTYQVDGTTTCSANVDRTDKYSVSFAPEHSICVFTVKQHNIGKSMQLNMQPDSDFKITIDSFSSSNGELQPDVTGYTYPDDTTAPFHLAQYNTLSTNASIDMEVFDNLGQSANATLLLGNGACNIEGSTDLGFAIIDTQHNSGVCTVTVTESAPINISLANETAPSGYSGNPGYTVQAYKGSDWKLEPDEASKWVGIDPLDLSGDNAEPGKTVSFGVGYNTSEPASGEAYFQIEDDSTSGDDEIKLAWNHTFPDTLECVTPVWGNTDKYNVALAPSLSGTECAFTVAQNTIEKSMQVHVAVSDDYEVSIEAFSAANGELQPDPRGTTYPDETDPFYFAQYNSLPMNASIDMHISGGVGQNATATLLLSDGDCSIDGSPNLGFAEISAQYASKTCTVSINDTAPMAITLENDTAQSGHSSQGYTVQAYKGASWKLEPDDGTSKWDEIDPADLSDDNATPGNSIVFGATYETTDTATGEAYFQIEDDSTSGDAEVKLSWNYTDSTCEATIDNAVKYALNYNATPGVSECEFTVKQNPAANHMEVDINANSGFTVTVDSFPALNDAELQPHAVGYIYPGSDPFHMVQYEGQSGDVNITLDVSDGDGNANVALQLTSNSCTVNGEDSYNLGFGIIRIDDASNQTSCKVVVEENPAISEMLVYIDNSGVDYGWNSPSAGGDFGNSNYPNQLIANANSPVEITLENNSGVDGTLSYLSTDQPIVSGTGNGEAFADRRLTITVDTTEPEIDDICSVEVFEERSGNDYESTRYYGEATVDYDPANDPSTAVCHITLHQNEKMAMYLIEVENDQIYEKQIDSYQVSYGEFSHPLRTSLDYGDSDRFCVYEHTGALNGTVDYKPYNHGESYSFDITSGNLSGCRFEGFSCDDANVSPCRWVMKN